MHRKRRSKLLPEGGWGTQGALRGMLSTMFALMIIAAAFGQEPLLDLTGATGTKSESFKSYCVEGGLGGSDHGPPPVLPFELQIAFLNANRYKEGDDLRAELLLTNKAPKSVLVPVSLDPRLIYAAGCKRVATSPGARALLGEVSLILEDRHGFWEAIDGAFTYGLSDDPRTYVELGPGKSLRMRTAGKVNLYNMIIQSQKATVRLEFPAQVEVSAKFNLDDAAMRGYRPVTSENRLRITLEKQIPQPARPR